MERSFAHLYETGGMRRVHLRGRDNILKRLLVHAAAFNISLILRQQLGAGKPPQLQGASLALFAFNLRLLMTCEPHPRLPDRRTPETH
jgi:transposase